MLLTTHGFNADYKVERAPGNSAVGVALEFRRPKTPGPQYGIAVQAKTQGLALAVTPLGCESWIGHFEGGPEGLDGVFATPRADTVCVVVKGQGYWVPVLAPAKFELIRAIPIKQVIPVADRSILIFVSYTRLAAYGVGGFLWLTGDLSWDGLEITDVSSKAVLGIAWDSPTGRRVSFSVEVDTGKSEGGSSPEKYGAVWPAGKEH